jgi:Fe-S cluster assembly protein SufD
MIEKLIDNSFVLSNKSFLNINGDGKKLLDIEVVEDTQFLVDLEELAGIEVNFLFNKSNINSHVIGLYSLKDKQKLDVVLKAVHNVSNTSCLIDIKGVLYDDSQSFHMGEIYIGKNAFKTESYLNDHSLLLGNKSKTIAMPNLRIHNNDVKASHGASIGALNEEKLYYLQSRGFDKKEAIDILVTGFFESTFNDITDQNMANPLRHKLLTSLV